jgi:hypothetical protein
MRFTMNKIRGNQSSVTTWLALIIISAVLYLISPSTAEAAIAVDGTPSTNTGTGSTITVSHTTGSGTNRLMLVGISIDQTGLTVSSVTYNGDPLELVGLQDSGSWEKVAIYKLVGPDIGTHDVVVNYSRTGVTIIGVMTFTGVDQTTPLGTFAGANTNSVNVSSATGELVFDTVMAWSAPTAGVGQTQRWNTTVSGTYGAGSTEPGAETVTMSWSAGECIAAVPIKPAGVKVDAVSSNTGTGSTITVSHTTSGMNRLMLVGIGGYNGDGVDPNISSVTYGGVALTLVGTQDSPWTGERMWIYKLVAPASGTANLIVTFEVSMKGAEVGVVTFTGVDQTTPLGTFVSASGTSATASVNVSSDTAELVFDTCHYGGTGTMTVGGGQIEQWNLTGETYSHTSGSIKPGAATVPMSWSLSTSDTWAIGAVPIKPASAPWLTGWCKRVNITIDHNDFDEDVTHFPVLVHLSSACGKGGAYDMTPVFDEVGANSKRIAVTKADGETQLYVEIEKWDAVAEEAWLWVSKSDWTISSTVDTNIYLYYCNSQPDNTDYVGDSGSRTEVWNSNFKGVWHLGETASGSSSIEFVNETHGYGSGSATTIAASATSHTAGNLLAVIVGNSKSGTSGVTVSSISDTAGNTYTFIDKRTEYNSSSGYTGDIEIWYAKNISGNANNVVTATFSASTEYREISVLQYSGADTSAPYDVSNTGTGTSTSQSTAASTTTYADEVIVAGYYEAATGTFTAGTNFALRYDGTYLGTEGRVVSSTGSYGSAITYSTSASYIAVHATFKAASSVKDSTSNANHGTPGGGPTFGATGEINSAINFDGDGDYVDVGDIGIDLEKDFSISAWMKFDTVSDERMAVGIGDSSAGSRLAFGHYSDGKFRVLFREDDNTNVVNIYHSGSELDDNKFHHCVFVFNISGNSYTGYVDGSSIESQPPGSYTSISSDKMVIGSAYFSGSRSQYFNGLIDEVRISDSVRSAAWVKATYETQRDDLLDFGSEESGNPTAVTLTNFKATQYEDGVLLRWKTGYEVNNLGFHIYREENGQLVRLTPEPVAGSALLAGSCTALTAGRHYHWWDISAPSSQLSAVRYWLKDIDLSGKETMHGPVTPMISREPIPEKFRPELLSEIGWRLQERYRDYWRVRELKEKLNDRYRSRSTTFKDRSPRGIFAPYSTGQARGSLTLEAKQNRSLASSPAGTLHKGSRLVPQANAMQEYLAGRSAVKLFVKEEGWYRVSQSELMAAGLSSRINPRYLQLYVEGREQPIRVIGEEDGRFGPGDAIEFYGVGLDTLSTDTRVYWLIEGSRPGKRIQEFKGYSGSLGLLSSSSFPYTVEKKDRTVYFAALRNGDEGNFFGPVVYMNRVDQILELEHLDRSTAEDALLEVVLQGVTEGSHRVKVLFNEVEVGEFSFEGQSQGLFKVEVSQSGLLGRENLVSVVGQGGEMDVSLLDFIRLSYWHTYTADNDSLKCRAQGGRELTVDGFSHSRVRVMDITDPDNVFEVFGRVRNGELGYGVRFRVPESGERTLLAFTEEKAKSPMEVFSDRPSFWHEEREGYDLIIISHRDFFDSLQPLKSLREPQGLGVALVDVEDIYDEFSFGHKSPQALRDFLGLAGRQWRKAPRYVLLVGDASYDPRNYLGLGDFDFLPTKLIDTAYMETASDDWFVDFNNDGLPEMAIGRLPVQTADEASIVVSKIIGYERSGVQRVALLVADIKEKDDDFDFEGASEGIKALLPSSLMVRKIYRSQFSSDSQTKSTLLDGINEGPLLVNFIGHGSVEVWRGNILTSDDAEGLINQGLSFFVNMTCFNGFFQAPYADTLAEALLKAEKGGAIAVWTSSGMTEPGGQTVMDKELIRLLFNGESITLGEATAKAKASVGDQDVRRTWILFGDPATRLK